MNHPVFLVAPPEGVSVELRASGQTAQGILFRYWFERDGTVRVASRGGEIVLGKGELVTIAHVKGEAIHARQLARQLRDTGYRVRIVSRDMMPPPAREQTPRCPKCGERDRMVPPGKPFRASYYCHRCKRRPQDIEPHERKRYLPDFDPEDVT